jgi:2'-5' RNA ligase
MHKRCAEVITGSIPGELATESALAILVPEAEFVVKPFRDKYDTSAAKGFPAHVTLSYPFKSPDEITEADLDNLRRCFAPFRPFHFTLSTTRRFPNTLYFAPQPDEPFRQMTFAARLHCR